MKPLRLARASHDEANLTTPHMTAERALLSRLKQAVIELDSAARVRWLNSAAEQMLGTSAERCYGHCWADLVQHSHPDGRPFVDRVSEITLTLADAQDRTIRKHRLSRRNIPPIIVSGECLAITKETGALDGCLLILDDISDSHHNNQILTWESTVLTLISSGASLELVLRSLTLGMETLQHEAKASVLLVNEQGDGLVCACAPSLPEHYPLTISTERIAADAGPSGLAAFSGQSIILSDIEQDDRWPTYRGMGRIYGLRAAWVIPVMDPFNQKVLATFNLYHPSPKTPTEKDLALLKRAANLIAFALERESIQRERDESDARFRQLAQEIDDVFWLSNMNGKLLYASPAFESIWGVGCDTLYQSPWLWLDSIVDEDRPGVTKAMALQSSGHFHIEYRIRRPDGNIRWIEDRAFPVANAEGQPFRLAGIARDITRRKHQQQQQLQLMEALEQSNTELQQYASVVSHDLQEPLRKISYFSELLLSKASESTEQQSDYLRRIQNAAERMRDMVQDLLSYARLNQKRAEPLVDIDLLSLAKTVLQDLEVSVQESQASISLENLPVIRGQASLWRQLLQNLISNALKFQPLGQRPEIRLFCDLDAQNRLRFQCCDNGIGFDANRYTEVFKPFYRLHGRHQYEGNGIGLAIVKKVADWHGLTITVNSQVGHGSRFCFTWPMSYEESQS